MSYNCDMCGKTETLKADIKGNYYCKQCHKKRGRGKTMKKVFLVGFFIVLVWETWLAVFGFFIQPLLMLSYIPHVILVSSGWHYLYQNWIPTRGRGQK